MNNLDIHPYFCEHNSRIVIAVGLLPIYRTQMGGDKKQINTFCLPMKWIWKAMAGTRSEKFLILGEKLSFPYIGKFMHPIFRNVSAFSLYDLYMASIDRHVLFCNAIVSHCFIVVKPSLNTLSVP